MISIQMLQPLGGLSWLTLLKKPISSHQSQMARFIFFQSNCRSLTQLYLCDSCLYFLVESKYHEWGYTCVYYSLYPQGPRAEPETGAWSNSYNKATKHNLLTIPSSTDFCLLKFSIPENTVRVHMSVVSNIPNNRKKVQIIKITMYIFSLYNISELIQKSFQNSFRNIII